MKRFAVLTALILSLSPLSLAAEGAGGVEFLQVVGQDLWPFPGKAGLPATTGTISSVGGLGYGVDEDGSVMGGFGMGINSDNLYLANSPTGQPIRAFRAGYGGTVQGWQHRWGPLVGLFTTRVGFGGADYSETEGLKDFSLSTHVAGFSLLGTAGAQLGLTVLPWFVIGVEAGVAGTVTFAPGHPFLLGYAPTIGVRLLWGAF